MLRRSLFFIVLILISYSFRAQVLTEWVASDGLEINVSIGTITKTAPDGWNNAGTISQNVLYGYEDGIIKYVINDLTSDKAIGFSSKNYAQEINSLD